MNQDFNQTIISRIRSAEASRNPSMSETTSVAIQETETVEEEGEIEPEGDASVDKVGFNIF